MDVSRPIALPLLRQFADCVCPHPRMRVAPARPATVRGAELMAMVTEEG